MSIAEYVAELKNTLFKINKQSWTEIKMLENRAGTPNEASKKEIDTLEKAKQALTLVMEILGNI